MKQVITRELVVIADNPDTLIIDATAELALANCGDLRNISAFAVQHVDAGTVTLQFEYSPDGVVWFAFGAAIAESDFAAGVNAAVARTMSDANGMPLVAQQVRLRAAALAGGGAYKARIVGEQAI